MIIPWTLCLFLTKCNGIWSCDSHYPIAMVWSKPPCNGGYCISCPMDPIVSRGFSQLPGKQFGVFLGTRGKMSHLSCLSLEFDLVWCHGWWRLLGKGKARNDAWSTGRKRWKANLTEHGYVLMFGPTLEAKLFHCSHIPFVAYHLPALLKVTHPPLEKSISCSAWPLWSIVFCWGKKITYIHQTLDSSRAIFIGDQYSDLLNHLGSFLACKIWEMDRCYLDSTLPLVHWFWSVTVNSFL